MCVPLLWGCTQTPSVEINQVNMDFTSIRTIEVPECDIIRLEESSKSLLFDINEMVISNNKLIIHSRDFLHVFDKQGHFLHSIAHKGHGRGEYNHIANIFLNQDSVFIFDSDMQRLLCYHLDGSFITSHNITIPKKEDETSPCRLYPYLNSYISVNKYGGEGRDVAAVSRITKDLRNAEPLEGRDIKSGIMFSDNMFVSDSTILYWEPLCDTLFTITQNKIRPWLFFDFSPHTLPSNESFEDVISKIEYINNHMKDDYLFAGMTRFHQLYKGFLFFTCIVPDKSVCLCRCKINTLEIDIFKFIFPDKKYIQQPFTLINGDEIYIEIRDTTRLASNPSLFKINMSKL